MCTVLVAGDIMELFFSDCIRDGILLFKIPLRRLGGWKGDDPYQKIIMPVVVTDTLSA
jgi:hypothetical protein